MMYYYRRKANPWKWVIIIIILIVIAFAVYWFYVNYFSKIDVFNQPLKEDIKPEETIVQDLEFELKLFEGEVLVDIDNQGFDSAILGLVLKIGDKIKTEKNSRAILELSNGTVLRLSENTGLSFLSVQENNIIIEQIQGRTYHILTQQDNYQVNSLDTVISSSDARFEIITNADLNFMAVLNFSGRLNTEIVDSGGTVLSARVDANEKVLIDLKKTKAEQLALDEFTVEDLVGEAWYKWNFDLDEGQEIETEEEEEEPDFEVINDSLQATYEIIDNEAHFLWSAYGKEDFKAYKVVKSKDNGDLKYPDDPVIKESTDNNLDGFIDKKVELGQKYYYRVCVEKMTDKVVCGNIINLEIEKDEQAPAKTNLNISISVTGVALTWTENAEDDFKQYVVLKTLANPDPAYSKDKLVTIKKGQVNYLDNQVNITSVGSYYYQVCSFDENDNYACSNIVSVVDGQVK